MTTFPSVTGNQLIRALRKFGFEVIRVKGSHHFYSTSGWPVYCRVFAQGREHWPWSSSANITGLRYYKRSIAKETLKNSMDVPGFPVSSKEN